MSVSAACLAELIQPAIDQAKAGLPVSWNTMLRICEAASGLRKYSASAAIYLPDGLPPVAQQSWDMRHLALGKLADTLDHLARAGWKDFYQGDIAASLVADLHAGGCPITKEEMAAYTARIVRP